MKINKNDLVKHFELIVKQEMKNYQDSKLATNLSINNLKGEIVALSAEVDLNKCKVESDIKLQDLEREKVENEFNKFIEWKNYQDKDLNNKIDAEFKKISSSLKSLATSFKEGDELLKEVLTLSEGLTEYQNNNSHLEYYFNLEIARLKRSLKEGLKLQKEEILGIPSEAETVKKYLLDKMEVQNIDFQGVYREMTILKKDLYVVEKNIENIYNLIKRLKE